MNLYELLGALAGLAVILSTVGAATWKLGKSGRTEPSLAIYEQMNTALELQVRQLKDQNTDQQRQIEDLRTQVKVLSEEVRQRAKVQELHQVVVDNFKEMGDRMEERASQILGQVAQANAAQKGGGR